jgi:hypothetical protein
MTLSALYENTPWERLGPIAVWMGLVGLAVSVAPRRDVARDRGGSLAVAHLASLRALSAALVTVGLPFAVLWQRAHETYPHAFGTVVALVGVVFGVQGVAIGAARRRDPRWRWALSYGFLTATTAAAVALAALSRTIIAEGQVTAMVVALGFLLAGVAASLVETAMLAEGLRSELARHACTIGTLVGLAVLLAWQLPVVQFVEQARIDAIHPVHGSLYAFLAGLVAGVLTREMHHRWGAGAAVVAFVTAALSGYLLQSWFGVAVATIGISVALTLSSHRSEASVR